LGAFLSNHIFRLDKASGIITWLVVSGICISVMIEKDYSMSHILTASALYLSYITLWLCIVNENLFRETPQVRIAMIVVTFLIVIAIYFAVPYSFNSILMGILSGGLPYFLSIRMALLVGTLWSIPLFLVYQFYWGYEQTYISALLFWTFNMFAIIMVNTAKNEREAREEAQDMNRRLISTQALLSEATKQNERVRIARNIHDLLGHHLTALTINLQVASIKSEGEVKQSIEQCHYLAKLLLSDVREAVSDIRNIGQLNLKQALSDIVKQIPNLEVALDIPDELQIDDIHTADALIKCIQESITNTLRHAKGDKLEIALYEQERQLHMRITNNGNVPKHLHLGNGLRGMQERIQALKGKIVFAVQARRFVTTVNIPLAQAIV
jgi:signal transduction histidine kinase